MSLPVPSETGRRFRHASAGMRFRIPLAVHFRLPRRHKDQVSEVLYGYTPGLLQDLRFFSISLHLDSCKTGMPLHTPEQNQIKSSLTLSHCRKSDFHSKKDISILRLNLTRCSLQNFLSASADRDQTTLT